MKMQWLKPRGGGGGGGGFKHNNKIYSLLSLVKRDH